MSAPALLLRASRKTHLVRRSSERYRAVTLTIQNIFHLLPPSSRFGLVDCHVGAYPRVMILPSSRFGLCQGREAPIKPLRRPVDSSCMCNLRSSCGSFGAVIPSTLLPVMV